MSPDKNELNDETMEQISAGFGEKLGGIGNEVYYEFPSKTPSNHCTCSNCGEKYTANTERTDGFCPNCEPKPIPKIAPVGDLKTTVPELPKKDKLIKIH